MQMMDQEPILTAQQIRDYFDPRPAGANKLIAVGVVLAACLGLPLLLCGLSSGNIETIIGTFIWTGFTASPAILGIILLSAYNAKPRPTDAQYEAWVKSWQPYMQHHGMQQLGFSPTDVKGEILIVRGLVSPRSHEASYYHSQACPILVKLGKDGHLHSSINKFTIFYPTQHYIAVFNGDVNALSALSFKGTRTYFYDDIVGVDAFSFGEQLGSFTYNLQRFELRVSSGQSIGTTTRVMDDSVDQTVRSLRTLLRDKKYGTQGGGWNLAGS